MKSLTLHRIVISNQCYMWNLWVLRPSQLAVLHPVKLLTATQDLTRNTSSLALKHKMCQRAAAVAAGLVVE